MEFEHFIKHIIKNKKNNLQIYANQNLVICMYLFLVTQVMHM